jgi:hypothetical protein
MGVAHGWGMDFGVLMFAAGSGDPGSDSTWYSRLVSIASAYHSDQIVPDLYTIQSWTEHPVNVSDEDETYSFMNLVNDLIFYYGYLPV